MRVARIGDMRLPIPPVEYGGTQRCMAQMTAFQAAIYAHDVTVYGPADSRIIQFTRQIVRELSLPSEINKEGNIISVTSANGQKGYVRLRTTGHNAPSYGYGKLHYEKRTRELVQLLIGDEKAHPFGIIHVHNSKLTPKYLIPAGLGHKMLIHVHNKTLFKGYEEQKYPLVCISQSQAKAVQKKDDANVFAVIHHGLDRFTYHLTTPHAGYLVWVGRFIAEKGTETAIKIAKAANKPLVIAGMADNSSASAVEYFENVISPLIDITDTEFLDRVANWPSEAIAQEIKQISAGIGTNCPVIFTGSVNEAQKQTLYGNAMATLFPIQWPEPFGLVMIESMACGTPVIGTVQIGDIHCGAVKEVIEHGVTGMHIQGANQDEIVLKSVAALRYIPNISRTNVRRVFERDWTSEREAKEIDRAYRKFLAQHKQQAGLNAHRETTHNQLKDAIRNGVLSI